MAIDFSLPDHRPFPFRRPAVQAREHVVVSGHWLSSAAAHRILAAGGNAFDAGVAAGLCLNVVLPQWTSLGGVAPIVTYRASDRAMSTVSGLGWWPRRASVQFFKDHCGGDIPRGVLRSVVPSACDAWLTTLKLYGTMSLAEVIAPALDLAEGGFAAYPLFIKWMTILRERFLGWPADASAAVFLHDRQPPEQGWLVRQPALARTFKRLCQAEARAAGGNRERGIQAARDEFYRGEIARDMVAWYHEQGGLLELDDLADFSVEVERPTTTRYGDYEVHGCGFWCQGPAFQQMLNILDGTGLGQLEHNSPEYVHRVAEAMKLALADRDAFYGDPRFIDVPGETLLSAQYAAERRALIRPDRAWGEMPPHGEIPGYPRRRPALAGAGAGAASDPDLDTSYLCVVDGQGNAMSATPSDGCHGGPIVPALGHLLSTRGGQAWVDDNHPSSIVGRKRPRLTPNPAIITRNGELVMAFGTPGGDAQTQVMTQVFLNILEFGMDPQRAIEAPRFITLSHPETGHPHTAWPGRLELERGFPAATGAALGKLGHDVQRWEWDTETGSGCCAIKVDRAHGTLISGADPRRDSYAIGW